MPTDTFNALEHQVADDSYDRRRVEKDDAQSRRKKDKYRETSPRRDNRDLDSRDEWEMQQVIKEKKRREGRSSARGDGLESQNTNQQTRDGTHVRSSSKTNAHSARGGGGGDTTSKHDKQKSIVEQVMREQGLLE